MDTKRVRLRITATSSKGEGEQCTDAWGTSPVLALVNTWTMHKNNNILYVLTEESVAQLPTTS
jgi:hypothetical protein